MDGIKNIRDLTSPLSPLQEKEKLKDKGFGDRLKNAIKEVNNMQISGNDASEQVVKGTLGIHEGMLVLQEADLSMRLFLQVRTKVIEAYKEIMRIQS